MNRKLLGRWGAKAIALPIAALFISLPMAAAPAQAATLSPASPAAAPAYHLFDRLNTSARANCPYNGFHLYNYVGKVGFKPDALYKTVQYQNYWLGDEHHINYHLDGFSTGTEYNSCIHHDFYHSYYGVQKVWQNEYQDWLCWAGGCNPPAVSYGPVNKGAWP